MEADFRYTNFLVASDPPTPPPAGSRIDRPLSNPLGLGLFC